MKRKFGVALMATLTLWAGTAASTAKAAPRDAAATTSPCANLITGSELSAVTFFNVTNGLGVWSRNTHCGDRLVSTKDAGKSWRVVGGESPRAPRFAAKLEVRASTGCPKATAAQR
jgi:hypothetical protein